MSQLKKNNALAENFRNEGNAYFRRQNYFDALMQYNQSLCFAETGTASVGLAFANRSAVYVKLNQFFLCLENIQLARKHKYPHDNLEKLDQREKECREMMKTLKPNPDDDPFKFFKLSYPANKKYPGIVDCIELRNNQKFGNHLITTQNLKPGDIIAIEEPTFVTSAAGARLHRCSYCYKDNLFHMLPCPKCTKAMFCSKKCQKNATNEFHQFECNIKGNPDIGVFDPLRMVLKCLNLFDYNVEELQKFVDEHKNPVTILDVGNPNDPMYQKNMILVALSIRNAAAQFKMSKNMVPAMTSAFIKQHAKLQQLWSKHGRFLDSLLERFLLPSSQYGAIFSWFSRDINQPAESMKEKLMENLFNHESMQEMHRENIGNGLYPVSSGLLNGSCNSNIYAVGVSNKLVLIVSRPVLAGDQIFRKNSETFYFCGPAGRRQENTRQHFGYICDCEACKYNWPLLANLKLSDPSFNEDHIEVLSSFQQAKENIKKNNAYIEKFYKVNQPTLEVYMTIDNNIFEYFAVAKPSFYH